MPVISPPAPWEVKFLLELSPPALAQWIWNYELKKVMPSMAGFVVNTSESSNNQKVVFNVAGDNCFIHLGGSKNGITFSGEKVCDRNEYGRLDCILINPKHTKVYESDPEDNQVYNNYFYQ